MKIHDYLKYRNILIVLALALSSTSPAMSYSFSENILKFQQKLAKKGDPSAQYKLGLMYESGFGVEVDFDEALKWYKKASLKNNKAAARRINYIDILRKGYKPSEDGKWLKQLKADANANDGEAALLLGVLYKNGTAVKKNLKLSHKYLKKAVIKNVSGAEDELVVVRGMLDGLKEVEQEKQRQQDIVNEKRLADEEQARDEEKARNRAEAKQRKLKRQWRQQQRLAKKEEEKERVRVLALKQENAVPVQRVQNTIVNESPKAVINEDQGMSWAEAVEQERKKNEAEN